METQEVQGCKRTINSHILSSRFFRPLTSDCSASRGSTTEIATDLLDRYEREQFWEEVNASVDRLRADPVAWKDYKKEVEFLQRGSAFILDEPYFTPEEEEDILSRGG